MENYNCVEKVTIGVVVYGNLEINKEDYSKYLI
jgi:hypothetical protein